MNLTNCTKNKTIDLMIEMIKMMRDNFQQFVTTVISRINNPHPHHFPQTNPDTPGVELPSHVYDWSVH